MLEEIVRNIKQLQDFNQWTNSTQVKRWFQSLQNKKTLSFLKFDIVAFYPSITKRLFSDSNAVSTKFLKMFLALFYTAENHFYFKMEKHGPRKEEKILT